MSGANDAIWDVKLLSRPRQNSFSASPTRLRRAGRLLSAAGAKLADFVCPCANQGLLPRRRSLDCTILHDRLIGHKWPLCIISAATARVRAVS